MNTNEVGRITEAKVLARLVELGKHVLVPFSNVGRYDLLIDEGDGTYTRVECKTGSLVKGCVLFKTQSSGYSSTGKKRPVKDYSEDADCFGIWCRETDKVYMVAVAEATKSSMTLRVDAPKNNHKKRKWAKDYEV